MRHYWIFYFTDIDADDPDFMPEADEPESDPEIKEEVGNKIFFVEYFL